MGLELAWFYILGGQHGVIKEMGRLIKLKMNKPLTRFKRMGIG
jgi:hypothetical protein